MNKAEYRQMNKAEVIYRQLIMAVDSLMVNPREDTVSDITYLAKRFLMESNKKDSQDITYQRGVHDGQCGQPPSELSAKYLRGFLAGIEGIEK